MPVSSLLLQVMFYIKFLAHDFHGLGIPLTAHAAKMRTGSDGFFEDIGLNVSSNLVRNGQAFGPKWVDP